MCEINNFMKYLMTPLFVDKCYFLNGGHLIGIPLCSKLLSNLLNMTMKAL